MHPSTPLTSGFPLPPSSQHMASPYNQPAHPVSWGTAAAGGVNSGNSTYQDHVAPPDHMPPTPQQQQQQPEAIKEVEMKPLDLSLRAPRQSENSHTSSWPRPSNTSRSGSQRLSPYPILSQSSGSLSSSPSYRHLGSPCLAQSRSPLTRSISPYYPYHRQTPSPYYLSGSCTPPENCSSLQVLSSTNRLLNALSSVSASHLRSYDDTTSSSSPAPSDLMGVSESTRSMKDSDAGSRRHRHHNPHHHHHQQQQQQQQNNANGDEEVDADSEEPTYIDMDSSTTVVKSVPSRHKVHHHDPLSNHGMSSVYTGTTVMSSSSSPSSSSSLSTLHGIPMSHHAPLSSQQQHHNQPHPVSSQSSSNHRLVVAAESSAPQDLPSFLQQNQQRQHQLPCHNNNNNNSQAGSCGDYHQQASTSRPSFISNNLQSSVSDSSASPIRSLSSSHSQYLCDSSNEGNNNTNNNTSIVPGDRSCNSSHNSRSTSYDYCSSGNDKAAAPVTSSLASSQDMSYGHGIPTYHGSNTNNNQQQQQQQQQQHYHQNPDSSSSPSANLDSSSSSTSSSYSSTTSSSPWRATSTNAELASPGNSNSSTSSGHSTISSQQRPLSPHMSPDSNLSRSALSILQGGPSNKENIRFINGGAEDSSTVSQNTAINTSHSSAGGSSNSGTTSARRSFFQIDSSLLDENNGRALLADDNFQNGDKSGQCSVLDFWISKILMEETPRRRCSADIRQTVDGNKRIRLRLVDLIELQVEQSLLKA